MIVHQLTGSIVLESSLDDTFVTLDDDVAAAVVTGFATAVVPLTAGFLLAGANAGEAAGFLIDDAAGL